MIVATISRKGGVGKTTTTVNLAAALAERGQRVLLVDLDPQASTSRSLSVDRANLGPSIADVMLRNQPAASVIRSTAVENLDLITASADLNDAEHALSSSRRPEAVLQQALEPIAADYDIVMVDCPPSLSLLARNAIVASTAHIIPAVPHFLALEGLENLVPAIDRVGRRNNTSSQLMGVLLTVVDYRANLTRENVAAIRDRHKDAIMAIEIRINIRLAEAPQYGKTIFEHAPASTGAECYRLLAEEFMLRKQQLESRTVSTHQSEQRRSGARPMPHVRETDRTRTPHPGDESRTEDVRVSRETEPPNPLMPTHSDNTNDGDSTELDALNTWLNSSLSTH